MERLTKLALLALLALLWACTDTPPKVHYPGGPAPRQDAEQLVRANAALVEADTDSIRRWAAAAAPELQLTGRGLWLQVLQAGSGPSIKTEQVVRLSYRLSLLDGRVLYNSDSLGPKSFRVGQGGVETGLEDAILLLRVGDSAQLVLPPHLAHGLTGDQNRIPPRAIVRYHLRVLEAK